MYKLKAENCETQSSHTEREHTSMLKVRILAKICTLNLLFLNLFLLLAFNLHSDVHKSNLLTFLQLQIFCTQTQSMQSIVTEGDIQPLVLKFILNIISQALNLFEPYWSP